jgi:hypothetical protein
MAQATDYSLANQSGANFRSELNTILAASVSQNSGSTAPTTTYAFQFWIDTGVSPALLKIRNSANSAWITVGDVTAANLGLLTAATAASTYAPIASPTFTGTVTIPAGASISGFLTSATAASTYLALAGGTLTGDVTLNAQSDLRFADLDSSNWVALQAPSSISSNYTLTLPAADGTSNQALTTNGSGALSWASYLPLAGGTLSGSVTFASGQTYPQIPANSQTSAYSLVVGDAGKHISITTGGVTVPSGVFAIGDAVSIYNNSGSTQTITQGGSVTLRQAGTGNTGNRTLAQYGVVTILCVASNTFAITGAGLA